MAKMLRISPGEYADRMRRLRSNIAAEGLDAFVVSSFDSIYYLTGKGFEPLERPFFLLVRPDRPPKLLVAKLEELHLAEAHNLEKEDIETYWEYPAPKGRRWPEKLCTLASNCREIAVEPSISQECVEELSSFPVRCLPLVERLRRVKSVTEIGLIRRAAHYADYGVERLLSTSYYGATVAEGFAQTRTVTSRIIREVDDWQPLTSKVVMASWAAPRSAQPHSIPDLVDELREGPHVALVLTQVNGYAAEGERTYFTAQPSDDARRAFKAMLEARQLALSLVRPGVGCSELDERVNAFLTEEGYADEDQRLHRTGHGLGLGNHEGPWLAEGSADRLSENMVISIEPGIYLQDLGGFRHSDTVRVTADGYELLTNLPTDIESLTVKGWKPVTRLRGSFVRWALGVKQKRQALSSLGTFKGLFVRDGSSFGDKHFGASAVAGGSWPILQVGENPATALVFDAPNDTSKELVELETRNTKAAAGSC